MKEENHKHNKRKAIEVIILTGYADGVHPIIKSVQMFLLLLFIKYIYGADFKHNNFIIYILIQ